jgi:hypothetical protein
MTRQNALLGALETFLDRLVLTVADRLFVEQLSI